MRRNCALSPKQLALWFAAISSVSIAVGCFFALAGAWMVLPFDFYRSLWRDVLRDLGPP
ncbi:MAG: DUF2244 domain-containing protein, partial [Betaproteobacteria bacterium]|nr:DUF2244 domain-containing protein [Betaproteobacteria bacterium]